MVEKMVGVLIEATARLKQETKAEATQRTLAEPASTCLGKTVKTGSENDNNKCFEGEGGSN